MWQDERRELGGEWAVDEADGRIITWRREGERQKKELNESEEKGGHSESQCNEGIKE